MVDSGHADGLWVVQDVANYLRVPVNGVYKMTGPKARLKIPHVRLAGRLRFKKSDIDEWLELLTVSNLAVLRKLARATHHRGDHGIDSPQETS